MIPVFQQHSHIPAIGEYGDCFSACLASILELDIDDVPHFTKYNLSDDDFWSLVKKWIIRQGYSFLHIPFDGDPRQFFGDSNPNIYYILCGCNEDGIPHSIVCKGNEMIHDPAGGEGLATGTFYDEDGEKKEFWFVQIIGAGILNGEVNNEASNVNN